MAEYLSADLIGKTLIEKTATPIQLLVTDSLHVLPIRSRIELPVIAAVPESQLAAASSEKSLVTFQHDRASVPLTLEGKWSVDEDTIRAILNRVDAALDLAEPFARIREAMGEARKLGVTNRAA